MRVGVPTEVADREFRVAITPSGVHELTSRGQEVLVGAGRGSAIDDRPAGCTVCVVGDRLTHADPTCRVHEFVFCRVVHGSTHPHRERSEVLA